MGCKGRSALTGYTNLGLKLYNKVQLADVNDTKAHKLSLKTAVSDRDTARVLARSVKS